MPGALQMRKCDVRSPVQVGGWNPPVLENRATSVRIPGINSASVVVCAGLIHYDHGWRVHRILRRGMLQPERLGSGDGEWERSITGQMSYEPLPASVLFAFIAR
jgi:hypothetical protein